MKVASPPLTNDAPSSVATQFSSPSPKRLYSLPSDLESDDHERAQAAAAAAAARRKRRKVLVRRSLQNRQKRTKIDHPGPLEASKRPLSASPTPQPTVIQPTTSGMEEVVAKLLEGQAVAIPTECTYEAVAQLNWRNPNSWSSRIQDLSGKNIRQSSNQATEDKICYPRQVSSTSVCSFSSDGSATGIESDSMVSLDQIKKESYDVPHVYLLPTALDGPFWRQCFPKRPYAVKSKDGEVLAAHAFNEAQQLLRLLANKVWPGPLLIHVAMDRSFPESLTVHRHGKRYLSLRALCHPLAVKVHQEYHAKNADDQLLVGVALRQDPSRSDGPYITDSNQVDFGISVLNGEERKEIFAVPTCEYGEPCSTSLWLDASRRVVILSCRGGKPLVTAEQLQKFVHHRKAPKNDRDRVIVAVLSRWSVVEESSREDFGGQEKS
ncbi:hypothetical protein FisN_4Hh272 [Fistulifera solaris]|uniref:Uncharacterized protein n=1 Tax=Fistulifera solaris TaxID=1519565 RepID=A0A1Z5KEG9_FISSO|nr:hypothetical protein FisN_4Hh272 [Fistulifera solaris]|eukprot:GAX24714.1 hypothetical protein FisN_4Hh272 [Fistulifera solaris]